MAHLQPQTRYRLRAKTSVRPPPDMAEAMIREDVWLPDFMQAEELAQEERGRHKAVYLVTFLALANAFEGPANAYLRCPSRLARDDVAHCFAQACAQPVYSNAGNAARARAVILDLMVVFQEKHAPREEGQTGKTHFHVAVKAAGSFRFAPVKRALLTKFGLATHWSTSHDGVWSAVRYGTMPSPKKPRSELDTRPLVWSRHRLSISLVDLSQEPTTAHMLKRKREKSLKDAAEAGKHDPRASEMDLYAVIVAQGFRNTPDFHHAADLLISYLKKHGDSRLVSFAFKIRARLSSLIDDVWSWERVDARVALSTQTRVQRLLAAASQPCICEGMWRRLAEQSFQLNGIDAQELCANVFRSLRDGRREDRPVVTLVGKHCGEGKSFFFAPLRQTFGQEFAQEAPQPGAFPLLGLEKKSIAILDDWHFQQCALPTSLQPLWFEGKPVPVTRPQNRSEFYGHFLYEGTAPVFITCKETGFGPLWRSSQRALRNGEASETSMLARRVCPFWYAHRLPVHGHVPVCVACFAATIRAHSNGGQ